MRSFRLLFLLGLLAPLVISAAPAEPKTPEELIRAMHDRYAKTWYKTMTFVQKTTQYAPDGTSKAVTWYEALSLPGKLRIDFEPIAEGNGLLFANDTQYSFKNGAQASSRQRIHPLLVLGFDVYTQPAAETMAKLKQLGYDLSVLHEDTWQGRPAYVVGAPAGDLRTRQFWVDKANLYFVRLLEPGRDGTSVQETQFNKYQRAGSGGWVSAEVLFMANGKPLTLEEYTDIKTDMALDEKLFIPENWRTAHWR